MKQVKHFLEFSSVVTWRIPVYEDGTSGIPEVLKKFTTPLRSAKKSKPKKIETIKSEKPSEEWI